MKWSILIYGLYFTKSQRQYDRGCIFYFFYTTIYKIYDDDKNNDNNGDNNNNTNQKNNDNNNNNNNFNNIYRIIIARIILLILMHTLTGDYSIAVTYIYNMYIKENKSLNSFYSFAMNTYHGDLLRKVMFSAEEFN